VALFTIRKKKKKKTKRDFPKILNKKICFPNQGGGKKTKKNNSTPPV